MKLTLIQATSNGDYVVKKLEILEKSISMGERPCHPYPNLTSARGALLEQGLRYLGTHDDGEIWV